MAFTSPLRHLPGPWYTRFTHLRLKVRFIFQLASNNLQIYSRNSQRAVITGQRIFYIDSLHKQYGPVVRISPWEVAISNLEDFQKIHKIGSGFLKSTWYQKLANFPKPGVFTMTDPKEHGPRRKLLSRPFSRSFLVEHWEPVVKKTVALAVSRIKDAAREGNADVFQWWMLLASDVSAHLAFGESFRMLEAGKVSSCRGLVRKPSTPKPRSANTRVIQKTQYLRVLQKLTKGAGISVEMPIFRLLRYVPNANIQEMFNANEYLIQGADKAVQMAKERHGQQANIFARVLDEAEKEGEGIDDMDVRVEALNIIIAGTDTTGVTLTYLTWAVLQRPQLQKELEAEVATLPEGYTENDLQALPLLNAVIEETHRLYGAAPSSLPRVVPQGGTNMSGFFIPGGTTVCTQAYTLHRDPTIWHDPLK